MRYIRGAWNYYLDPPSEEPAVLLAGAFSHMLFHKGQRVFSIKNGSSKRISLKITLPREGELLHLFKEVVLHDGFQDGRQSLAREDIFVYFNVLNIARPVKLLVVPLLVKIHDDRR
jgi:hypothetical protein